ncbi:WhiB family transcriptional regulator [Yinghuangia soli]|uniref:WhiB family transcriptional regulator n=1 Tax=Yinghuangia soli TaxID=2908204 RepID=A0AA41PYF6_9ACTN|nr:WhiB family transcriptional regulator [Yinghuangia soli]MCF2528160.1 WhiB family transcriptional regulator [Yinghuangia soli]
MPDRSDLPSSARDIAEPAPRATTWIPPAAGACRSEDLRLFLGMPGEPAVARIAREEEAKRICACCGVLLECRAAALADGAEPTGVRGGLAPEEQRAIARRRRRRGSRRSAGR